MVRTRDLVLPPDLLERYNRETWRSRSAQLIAWCLAVMALVVVCMFVDLLMLEDEARTWFVGGRLLVLMMYFAAICALRKPWAYGHESMLIAVPTIGAMIVAGVCASATAPTLLELALMCALFIAATGVTLARISMRGTIALACATLAVFAVFIVTSPVFANHEKTIMLAFFVPGTLAVTEARRIQTLTQYRLFILHLNELIRAEKVSELNARLSALARTDALTEVPNRRFFDETMDALREGRAAHEPLSVLMIDIDYFKRLNDLLGHAQGDACLKAVAAALRNELRGEGDVVARFGGEEFVVVLSGGALPDAAAAADRLRRAVYDLALPHPASPWGRVTVSIGVAATPLVSFDALVAAADEALYQAKQLGRDRVFVYEALAWAEAPATNAA